MPPNQKTAVRTIFSVFESNLTLACFEEKMIATLPQIYPKDYFLFLDYGCTKWLIQFNIQDFYKIMNEFDPD